MAENGKSAYFIDRPVALVLLIGGIIAIAVFALTSIVKSRADNESILVTQGIAFTEAIAQSAQTAIDAETTYENLLQRRFSGILDPIYDASPAKQKELAEAASQEQDIDGIFLLDVKDQHIVLHVAEASFLPASVIQSAADLAKNPEQQYHLLLDQPQESGAAVHYYLEMSNDLQSIGVVVAEASYYTEALSRTQIGYVAQNIAKEKGVNYVLYQTSEGIIFSSRKVGQLLAIDSDPFLSQALESDTIVHRFYTLNDTKVMEFVRPFSSRRYPFGLLRVGVSLRRFNAISQGYLTQMAVVSGALIVLLSVLLLYVNSRKKRSELSRQFGQYKSISDTIFEQLVIGVAAVDPKGIIRITNSAFTDLLNVSNPVGKQWDNLFSGALALSTLIQRAKQEREFELSVPKNGATRSLLIGASPLPDGEGSGWVFVVSDVTRLKEMEQQSAHKERLSELGNLAAGVAHEIRNPLNAISIAAQRLETEYKQESSEYSQLTQQIRSETKRLNDIIAKFLALTRSTQPAETTHDLGVEIEKSLAIFRLEAEQAHITLDAKIPLGIRAYASPEQIRTIIANLFTNAREALDGKPGKLEVTLTDNGKAAILTFADSGPGIPADIRAKIFTPYFTTKPNGTGLGLAAVHAAVTSFGGTITVESSQLGGAKFVVGISK